MTRPTFLHGALVAAVLAFIASAFIATFTPFVGVGDVIRIAIPAVSLAYLLYLLRSARVRIGHATTLASWTAIAIATWWIAPPLPFYVLIHVGLIWLVRSLYFYAGLVPALLDLGLSLISVSAFVWAASRTGSVFLATWSLFLVQALFVAIPATIRGRTHHSARPGNETFERAHRQADAALRQLMSR